MYIALKLSLSKHRKRILKTNNANDEPTRRRVVLYYIIFMYNMHHIIYTFIYIFIRAAQYLLIWKNKSIVRARLWKEGWDEKKNENK